MDELELQHAEAHYAELSRDGYSGRCEMFLPEDLRGMRVLDLGCRNGKGAYKLADRVGPDGFVLGVDPSAACVARAEATAAAARAEGAAWAERLAFARGCFEGLRAAGVDCEEVKKVHEGAPNVLDRIAAGEIALMINTPFGHATRADGYELRLEAVKHGVTHVTNLAGAQAMVAGMEAARLGGLAAVALQDLPQWELSR